jgi:hypothetical protein
MPYNTPQLQKKTAKFKVEKLSKTTFGLSPEAVFLVVYDHSMNEW